MGFLPLRARFDASVRHDYSTSKTGIVPLDARRPMWHFVGFWATLVSGFGFMVLGFEVHDRGYGLAGTAGIAVLGYGIYVSYALVGAHLGSRSGQTLTLLTRSIFGRAGSWLVSLFVLVPALGWVGFQAGVLAQLWHGFYGWGHVEAITVAVAAAMIFNSLFGFSGISLFARYVVTPVLIVWCVVLVAKGFAVDSGRLGAQPSGHLPFWVAVTTAIGFALWGNEPDVWRYGQPRFLWPLPTYLFAALWFVLFAVGGWMMAELAGHEDRFNFTVHYSLFGLFWLAFPVATINQFAINDGNYYEAINAGQNLLGGWRRWRRIYTCLVCAAGGALAGWLVNYEISNGWYAVPTFLAITAPCATTIMVVDHFLLPRCFGISRSLARVPAWQETALGNWPAIVSLLVAIAYGAVASAILPGGLVYHSPRDWGPVPFECWLLAGALYVGLVAVARAGSHLQEALGFPSYLRDPEASSDAVPDIAATQRSWRRI